MGIEITQFKILKTQESSQVGSVLHSQIVLNCIYYINASFLKLLPHVLYFCGFVMAQSH